MKRLSKRSVIKNKKQQLCDKINQCKTLKELEGWEKTFSYHPILKDNQDWDYGFFLDLIEFKLRKMRDYFWTHNITVDEKLCGDQCNKAINILKAGYKTNIVTKEDLHNYVNTRNVHRFFTPKELNFILKEGLRKYYLPSVRETKAKQLFWKFLNHYIENWWD